MAVILISMITISYIMIQIINYREEPFFMVIRYQKVLEVYESHIICGTCRKDFGSDDDAVVEWMRHAAKTDFFVGCSNYFVEYIVAGKNVQQS